MLTKEQLSYVYIALKLIAAYVFFSICFYGYVGLIDSRGSVYSPFLAEYSLIDGILIVLIYPCVWILELLGFTSKQSGNFVGIENGIVVYIAFACLGIKIMIAHTSLMLAFPGKQKIKFWLLGILSIHALNIIRVVTIILMYNHDRGVVHLTHDLFNYFGYGCVCLFFYLWYSKYGDFQKS